MPIKNRQAGFTIFEVLIYIALFSFIIGGSITAAFQIFQGSAQIQAKSQQEVELNFVLRKLDWLLNGSSLTSPTTNTPTDTIIIDKGTDQFTLTTSPNDEVTLAGGGLPALPITSSRLKVSTLTFTRDTTVTPNTLTVDMVINGETLDPFIYYLRWLKKPQQKMVT